MSSDAWFMVNAYQHPAQLRIDGLFVAIVHASLHLTGRPAGQVFLIIWTEYNPFLLWILYRLGRADWNRAPGACCKRSLRRAREMPNTVQTVIFFNFYPSHAVTYPSHAVTRLLQLCRELLNFSKTAKLEIFKITSIKFHKLKLHHIRKPQTRSCALLNP